MVRGTCTRSDSSMSRTDSRRLPQTASSRPVRCEASHGMSSPLYMPDDSNSMTYSNPPCCSSVAQRARLPSARAAATSRTANGSVADERRVERRRPSRRTPSRRVGRSADPAAHHLEERLRELVGAARVVQHDGDAAACLRPLQHRAHERRRAPSRVVPARSRPPRSARRARAADPAACRAGRAARTARRRDAPPGSFIR